MDFSPSPRAAECTKAVRSFIRDEIAPVEHELHRWQGEERRAGCGADLWQMPSEGRELQGNARAQGLWNLFLPAGHEGPYAQRFGTLDGTGPSNVDDAPTAGATGWSDCEVLIVIGLTDPHAHKYAQHSMVLVRRDTVGAKGAQSEVSAIKIAAPSVAQPVVGFAMQIHGAGGLSADFPLAGAWTAPRAVRLADGPDEVHKHVVARVEIGKRGALR